MAGSVLLPLKKDPQSFQWEQNLDNLETLGKKLFLI